MTLIDDYFAANDTANIFQIFLFNCSIYRFIVLQ